MMAKIKRFLGMAWTTPAIRTGVQTVFGVVAAAAATDYLKVLDEQVWKTAAAAGVAAVLAVLQAKARA